MQKDGIKKILSIVLFSLTILGVGGVTISLINITIVLGSERGEKTYAENQDIDNVEEMDSIGYDVEIKSEEKADIVIEPNTSDVTTLFDLEFFSRGKAKEVTYIKDVFGNEYTHAIRIGTTVVKEEYMFDYDYVTEFFLNKEYNKFSCKVFFPEEAYGTEQHRLLIWGDGKQLEVVIVEKKSGIQEIEIDVKDVDYLQFAAVTEERHSGSALGIIQPYLEK